VSIQNGIIHPAIRAENTWVHGVIGRAAGSVWCPVCRAWVQPHPIDGELVAQLAAKINHFLAKGHDNV
jgi:hypothetical protein